MVTCASLCEKFVLNQKPELLLDLQSTLPNHLILINYNKFRNLSYIDARTEKVRLKRRITRTSKKNSSIPLLHLLSKNNPRENFFILLSNFCFCYVLEMGKAFI